MTRAKENGEHDGQGTVSAPSGTLTSAFEPFVDFFSCSFTHQQNLSGVSWYSIKTDRLNAGANPAVELHCSFMRHHAVPLIRRSQLTIRSGSDKPNNMHSPWPPMLWLLLNDLAMEA